MNVKFPYIRHEGLCVCVCVCVCVCGGITPIIRYLRTKWRSVNSSATSLLHPKEGVLYSSNKMLGLPQSRSASFGGKRETHDTVESQIVIPRFAVAMSYLLHGHLHIRHYCLNLQEHLLTYRVILSQEAPNYCL